MSIHCLYMKDNECSAGATQCCYIQRQDEEKRIEMA
jgi:hypothetical protein